MPDRACDPIWFVGDMTASELRAARIGSALQAEPTRKSGPGTSFREIPETVECRSHEYYILTMRIQRSTSYTRVDDLEPKSFGVVESADACPKLLRS